MGSVRGQMRGYAPVWEPEVAGMRKKAGERRARLQTALQNESTSGKNRGVEVDPADYLTEADTWQIKFESEADRIHELEQELDSLKGQLTGQYANCDPPPSPSAELAPQESRPKLGGEQPFISRSVNPSAGDNDSLLATVPAMDQPRHPLHRSGGVPQLKEGSPITGHKAAPLRGALGLGLGPKKGSRQPQQVAVPASRLGQVVRQALANGFKSNDQGEWAAAKIEFDKVLEADPLSAAAYYGKGYAYYLEGDHAASTEAYSKALQLDPEPTAKKICRPVSKDPYYSQWAPKGGKKKKKK